MENLSSASLLLVLSSFAVGVLSVKFVEWFLKRKNQDEKIIPSIEPVVKPQTTTTPETTTEKKEEENDEDWEDEDDDEFDEEESGEDYSDDEDDDPKKLLLLVRTDVNMQKGKMCAQCGHASLGAHCLIHSKYRKNPKSETLKEHMQWLHKWHYYGAAKIAVKVDKTQMDFFQTEAKKRGLPTYRVIDAGRTQIERGTATVLAIGPCPNRLLDFTKELKLL